MKGPLDRTKVVLRHLPPTLSQSTLMEQIERVFSGRYSWLSFRPGKISQRNQSHSRAYIDFKRAEDVIEFAEFFDGHVFVNEKGTQHKVIVEYAPSQRVPKQWSKKDAREGTISRDPEFLEFLEALAKPVENLPSAEIQLERKEAERAGAVKENPIITPLMDYVRQKRAAKSGSRRSISSGKLSRRSGGASAGNSSSVASKRASEKGRNSTTMRYVLRDSAKNSGSKEKSPVILVSKRDELHASDKSNSLASAAGNEVLEEESGISGASDIGKKKVVLLKGKEKEILSVTGSMTQQNVSPNKTISNVVSGKHSQRRDGGSGKIIKTILLNSNSRSNQSSSVQSEQQMHPPITEKDKRPPRTPIQLATRDSSGSFENKFSGNEGQAFAVEKQERRTRNKDRPDRAVWAPLHRSDGSYASNESLSSSTSHAGQLPLESSEGGHGETRAETIARGGTIRVAGSGRSNQSLDNGSHKHVVRRGPVHGVKDADGLSNIGDGKTSKRGGAAGYGSNEKQVWVQKPSSGS